MRLPKTRVLATISTIAAVACIYFIFLFWQSVSAGFPIIAPGSYVGEVEGLESKEEGKIQSIVFEKAASGEDLIVAISGSAWSPQIVSNFKIGGVALEGEKVAPVRIVGAHGEYQITGQQDKAGSYSGKVERLSDGVSGEWSVALVNEYPAIRNSKDLETIREFLALRGELSEVDSSINVSEISVTQQKGEIERLTHFLTEGESLKRNAEDKLRATKAELEKAKEELSQKQKEVRTLNEKLALSQRLTPMGRLVSLARESLDREKRWAESMDKTSLTEGAADFDNVVGRGERILLLKNEIEAERTRISKLSPIAEEVKAPPPSAPKNEPPSEEVLD